MMFSLYEIPAENKSTSSGMMGITELVVYRYPLLPDILHVSDKLHSTNREINTVVYCQVVNLDCVELVRNDVAVDSRIVSIV